MDGWIVTTLKIFSSVSGGKYCTVSQYDFRVRERGQLFYFTKKSLCMRDEAMPIVKSVGGKKFFGM